MTKNTSEKHEPQSDDILIAFSNEMEKVKENSRSLVIVTHGFIELLLNTVIDSKLKHGKKRITSNNKDYNLSVKLVILHELEIIDDHLFDILDWFRKLRNKAAHEPFFELDQNQHDFANHALDRFIPGESSFRPNDFFHFCHLLVDTIWNENLDSLLPAFQPELAR